MAVAIFTVYFLYPDLVLQMTSEKNRCAARWTNLDRCRLFERYRYRGGAALRRQTDHGRYHALMSHKANTEFGAENDLCREVNLNPRVSKEVVNKRQVADLDRLHGINTVHPNLSSAFTSTSVPSMLDNISAI